MVGRRCCVAFRPGGAAGHGLTAWLTYCAHRIADTFMAIMPWKKIDRIEQRFELIRQMSAGELTVSELCRRAKISRQTAYKWRRRYQTGRLKGLADRSRIAKRVFGRTPELWLARLRRIRGRRPSWGARKLHDCLGLDFGKTGLPSVAAIGRWLKRWGLTSGKGRRQRGPMVLRAAVRAARYAHLHDTPPSKCQPCGENVCQPCGENIHEARPSCWRHGHAIRTR